MTPPRIYAYECADPDCPEEFRAVAHWVAPEKVRAGQNAGKTRLALQVATATGRTAQEAGDKLAGFLDKETEREEARVRKSEATSVRIKAMHAERRAKE